MNTFLTTLVLATIAIAGANAQACPTIISRAQWGARDAAPLPPTTETKFVIVHHTAGVACRNLNTCSAQMRAIQNTHIDKNGWQDIGYNFCIGGDGLIYEGRGWQAMGAHTPGYNHQSLGICFLGDFTSVRPTLAARNNAQSLIRCGFASGRIDNDYLVIGHSDVIFSVTCPGTALLDELRTWPYFNNVPTPPTTKSYR